MNESKIKAQLDTHCPCMSKPLNECDCSSEEEDYSGLVASTTCPLCGSWDYEIDEKGNCLICGNTVDNI